MNYFNTLMGYAMDIFIILLICLPPFIYLFQYVRNNTHNAVIRWVIYIFYWVGSIITSNLVPAATVLFLIIKSRKKRSDMEYREGDDEQVHFRFDASGDKWNFSFKKFLVMCLWAIVIRIVITYISYIVIIILNKLHIGLVNQEVINEFLNAKLLGTLVYFVIMVFGAPIVEEFVFRFFIYDKLLKRRFNVIVSAVLSSLLFMAAHFNIQGAATFFLIGIVNCYLYDREGYWSAVANHFMFNLVTTAALILMKVLNVPF